MDRFTDFEIGDRVICTGVYDGNRKIVGVAGTICGPLRETWCGVEYDDDIGGHNCHGNCDAPYGWETAYSLLELHSDLSPEEICDAIELPYEALNI